MHLPSPDVNMMNKGRKISQWILLHLLTWMGEVVRCVTPLKLSSQVGVERALTEKLPKNMTVFCDTRWMGCSDM